MPGNAASHPDHAPAASVVASEGERVPLAEQAYDAIRRLITENAFSIGNFVLEQELADRLGMSRTPVREATIRLVQEGLVEVRPRHGMRLLQISPQDMAEIYDILTALETLAVRNAASREHSAEDLALLDRTIIDMEAALATDDLLAWAEADERFHRAIVALSGNRKLSAAIGIYMDQVRRARMFTLRLRPKPTESNADHAAVVSAIRNRDPDAAGQIHFMHRSKSGQMLVNLLRMLDIRTI